MAAKPDWVNEIEIKYNMKLFGKNDDPDNSNAVFFIDCYSSQGVVKIDSDKNEIEIRRILHGSRYERGKTETEIANSFLANITDWGSIGLNEKSIFSPYVEIKEKRDMGHYFLFIYGEKEIPNAFGNFDWSEF